MVDPEVVRRRLRDIGERRAALGRVQSAGRERFISDGDVQAAAERHLQLLLQAAIDIAVHILAEDSAGTPESYGDAFPGLAELGVIDLALAARLRKAAGLRNILVHDYLDLDSGLVWEAVESLSDIDDFAAAVDRYVG